MARRPLRRIQESLVSRVPEGPLGFLGNGGAVGSLGVLGVGVVRGLVPIGEFEPGYNVESTEREVTDEGIQRIFLINAFSRDVAKKVAQINSSPSNIDLLARDIRVVSSKEVESRSTASTWEVVTVQKDRKPVEKIEDEEDA